MRWIVLGSVAMLAGCATTPGACDPTQAGFFSGISCESSGAYGSRDTSLRSNLASARANLASDRMRANDANVDAGAALDDQARARSALSRVRQQNTSLRARLDAASRREGANVSAINQQRAELSQLERDRASAERGGSSPDAVRDIQRRQKALLDATSSY